MRLEHVVPGDWDTVRRNFERLMGSIDTGGVSAGIRFGQETFTFASSTTSNTRTINHGLGRTPIAAFVSSWVVSGVASGRGYVFHASFDDTSFQAIADASGSINTTITTSWVAIG